jgi:thioredoxin-related protein
LTNLSKKIELIANVAIILVAVLIVGALVKNYIIPTRQEAITGIHIGNKISLPDVDWAKNGQTLLLVLQKDCHFCTASAQFYQRLVSETTGNSNIRLVAVLPNAVEESKQYLSYLGVSVNEVRQASLRSLGVGETPTLILVDKEGKVAGSWIGQLPSSKEGEVLKHLQVNTVANSVN